MHLFRRSAGLLAAFLLALVAAPAPTEAAGLDSVLTEIGTNLTFPDVQDWAVGQQSTHALSYSGSEGTFTANVRMAITGQEEGYQWLELNLTDLGGTLGQDIAPYLGALHLRFLTRALTQGDLAAALERAKTDPMAAVDPQLVRKIQLQWTGSKLYELTLEEMQDMASGALAMSGVETTPEGEVEVPEVEGDMDFNTGTEDVTVPAGLYNDTLFWDALYTDPQGSGNTHINLHENVPLLPLVKLVFSSAGTVATDNMQVKLELKSSALTGAATRVTGEPVPFDINDVIGAFMGTATLE